MQKFLAKNTADYSAYKHKNCDLACKHCKMCKKETRDWDKCWSACDNCNKCHANVKTNATVVPYFHTPPLHFQNNFTISPKFCSNVCGYNACQAYRKRYDNYVQCKRCQQKGQCWSEYQKRCVQCNHVQLLKSCEDKFGCPNATDSRFPSVPPRDPMYNNCQLCWQETDYTTF